MNEKQIGIKINTTLSGKTTKQLKDYADQLSRIQAFSKGIDKGTLQQIDETNKSVEKVNKSLNETSNITGSAFKLTSLASFGYAMKSLIKTLGNFTDKSAEYTENINLYKVAFNGATDEADAFVDKLTEMYGLDESWLVRTTGLFKQLSNAMSLSEEQGTKLAKLMTQMSIDMSSLYNLDIERASSVLQSSLAGQTKPIRGATGGDITQPTLQTTLDNLGIEKAVTQLSFAEKRLLIIISLTEQLGKMTNDFGKTIESPANQTRILSEQWARLTRAVGNVFMPIVAKVLPYLNAILMVLTEIINLVATLFGFELEDFDYGVAGLSDSFLEMEENIDGATNSVKKLKHGLRGFDKLNVITTPSSGGSGSGAGGGIDPEIMDAFNKAFDEYNSKLEDVRMKANIIRDAILDWLGFTDGTYKNLKLISGILGVIVGYKLVKGIAGLVTGTSKLGKLLGTGGLFAILKKIVKAVSVLGLKDGFLYLFYDSKLYAGIKAVSGAFSSLATALGISSGALLGIVGAIVAVGVALVHAYKTSDEFKEKIDTMIKSMGDLFGLIYKNIVDNVSKIWEYIEPIVKIIKEVVMGALDYLYQGVKTTFENIATVITGSSEAIQLLLQGDLIGAFNAVKDSLVEVKRNNDEHWDLIAEKIKERAGNIVTILKEELIPKFKEKMEELIKKMEELPEKFGYWIGEAVGKIIDKITTTDWVAEGKKIVDGIVSGLKITKENVTTFFTNLYNSLKQALKGINWSQLGMDVLKGIINGMTWKQQLKNSFANGFINGIKDALKIHSPSRLVIENKVGDNVFAGITSGIENEIPKLKYNAKDIVGTLNDEISKTSFEVKSNSFMPNILGQGLETPVMNNDYSKSDEQKKTTFNPTFIIQVGDKEIAKTVLSDLQGMAKSDGKPIIIQG